MAGEEACEQGRPRPLSEDGCPEQGVESREEGLDLEGQP